MIGLRWLCPGGEKSPDPEWHIFDRETGESLCESAHVSPSMLDGAEVVVADDYVGKDDCDECCEAAGLLDAER